jgi:hypothetical protein
MKHSVIEYTLIALVVFGLISLAVDALAPAATAAQAKLETVSHILKK